jgi:predicted RNase H-like nuclease (RuvC/YqgF family)
MIILNHGHGDRQNGESEMDKMDSLVDLVRALAKKCEELENTQQRLEMYERWYKEGKEEIKELRQQLNRLAICTSLDSGLPTGVCEPTTATRDHNRSG